MKAFINITTNENLITWNSDYVRAKNGGTTCKCGLAYESFNSFHKIMCSSWGSWLANMYICLYVTPMRYIMRKRALLLLLLNVRAQKSFVNATLYSVWHNFMVSHGMKTSIFFVNAMCALYLCSILVFGCESECKCMNFFLPTHRYLMWILISIFGLLYELWVCRCCLCWCCHCCFVSAFDLLYSRVCMCFC